MDLNEVPRDHNHMVVEFTMDNDNINNNKLEDSRNNTSELEEKLLAFDLEIRKKDKDLEEIKAKIMVFEGIKVDIEEEIKDLRRKKTELEGTKARSGEFGVGERNVKVESEEGLSKVDELMIEIRVLECEKRAAIKEVEGWKRKCEKLELRVRELEGKDSLLDGMKGAYKDGNDFRAATEEVEVWKRICEELESRVRELEGRLDCEGKDRILDGIRDLCRDESDVCAVRKGSRTCSPGAVDGGLQMEGTPLKRKHANRQLAFHAERHTDEKIAPNTPAGVRHCSAVVEIDSDDEPGVPDNLEPSPQTDVTVIPRADVGGPDDIMDEDDENFGNGNDVVTPKRKRYLKIFASDDEYEDSEATSKRQNVRIYNSDKEGEDDDILPIKRLLNRVSRKDNSDDDEDDNIPISQLTMNQASCQPADSHVGRSSVRRSARLSNSQTHSRRHLVKHGQSKQSYRAQDMDNSVDDLTKKCVEDDGSEDDDSGSDDSMGSFIVDDCDIENAEDDLSEDGNGNSHVSEEASDDNLDFGEILSRIGSRKDPSLKWNLEGEMLSDFGKDPELCMRAVCALYRQQTTTEKACKESIVQNGRGFSKFDASRGTKLGEFLTGGDSDGDLVRTVEELRKFDPEGPKTCSRLARHYSKQLFEIYQNNEDPFFP